jgi:branched-chain amino acid transport system ATP-binding protein
MHESSLVAEDIRVAYGAVGALRDVSIEVPSGACVALVGANGAGKSSFLNAVSGTIRPQSGDIRFAGTSILRWPSYKVARAGLIHIPEGRGILPSLTVRENIRVVLDSLGKGSDPNDVYTLFPKLKEREQQVAGTLSGGEQQMLAIALGLLARPKLMAIDEPSLGLAPILIQEVFHALNEVKRRGVSLLLVEQYVSLVMGLADVVYILDKGSVVFSGAPAELERSALADVYLGTHAVGADATQTYADAQLATAEVSFRLTARELRTLEKQAHHEGREVGALLHDGLTDLLERTR